MTEHEKTKTRLGLLLGGALSAEEERALQNHLARCAECSRRLEDSRRLADAVASAPGEVPSPALVARIVDQAQSRRLQVIQERGRAWRVAGLALLGWTLVLISVPVWREILNRARAWLSWPGETGPVAALLAGAVFT